MEKAEAGAGMAYQAAATIYIECHTLWIYGVLFYCFIIFISQGQYHHLQEPCRRPRPSLTVTAPSSSVTKPVTHALRSPCRTGRGAALSVTPSAFTPPLSLPPRISDCASTPGTVRLCALLHHPCMPAGSSSKTKLLPRRWR